LTGSVAIGLAVDARGMGFLSVADCGRVPALLTTLGLSSGRRSFAAVGGKVRGNTA
jgi:hypothetical protein